MSTHPSEDVKTIQLTDKIFKESVLISPSLGFWDGKIQQSEEDIEATKARIDSNIFTPGFKFLVPKESVQRFVKYRVGLQNYMRQMSFDFPLRGVRFVPESNLDQVLDKLKEMKKDFELEVEEFCAEYPRLKESQVRLFNSKYPHKKGQMEKNYPDASVIRSKFHFDWVLFRWNACDIARVQLQETSRFQGKMEQFLENCARNLRRAAFESAETFSEAICNSKHKINERSVLCFADFLERFDSLNFMGDERLAEEINRIQGAFGKISDWTTDQAELADIQGHLSAIMEVGKREHDAPTILDRYIRSISMEDVEEEMQVQVEPPPMMVVPKQAVLAGGGDF